MPNTRKIVTDHTIHPATIVTRQHVREKNKNRQGRLDFDLAVYASGGPYVLIAAVQNREGHPIIIAEPLRHKDYGEIRAALASAICQAQHVWNCDIIDRVHGDGERGLIANVQYLHESGISCTITQGHDPQANGTAEAAVGLTASAAKANPSPFIDMGSSGATIKALWPAAMVHAAYNISLTRNTRQRG